MEIIGEFLGIDTDKGLSLFFRRHYGSWFPAMRQVHRTTFTGKPPTCGRSKPSCGGRCWAGSTAIP
jgi:hypothetical protein